MEMNKTVLTIVALSIAVIMTMGVLTPTIIDAINGEKNVNDGAGWIRMTYDTDPSSTYTINISSTDGVTVANGTDIQSGNDMSILYADSNLAIWTGIDSYRLLGTTEEGQVYADTASDIEIVRDTGGVVVTMNGTEYSFDTPSWAYIPTSTGNYGFFENGTPVQMSDAPIASVGGGNAGVYAYNNILRYNGLGLTMQTITNEDGSVIGTEWTKSSDVETPNESPATSPNNDSTGWGYETMSVDGTTKAKITSYSGTGGDIIVPSSISGYDVYRFGRATPNAAYGSKVFNNANLSANSTITFSDNIVQFGASALDGMSNLTGPLILPSSVTMIGYRSFYGCTGFTGSLILPPNLTYLDNTVFYGCTGFTGSLVIPSSVTSIGNIVFKNCNGFTNLIISSDATPAGSETFLMAGLTDVLDLSDTVDYSVDRNGIPDTATVYNTIGEGFGYISSIEMGSESKISGPMASILVAVPVVVLLSLIIGTMTMIRTKE